MRRTLPPTAAPFTLKDLWGGVMDAHLGINVESRFAEVVRGYFGVRHVFLLCSGKAALVTVLKAMNRISGRREVIAPAYSSFCLASALSRSGLKIKLCDVDPGTLDFDFDMLRGLVGPHTLAVVPVHLYGRISRVDETRKIAERHGAWVIEDAAQAAGASSGGIKAGCAGDVGIFSLGRGKNVCALEGGVIVTNNGMLAERIAAETEELPEASPGDVLSSLTKGLGMLAFLNPDRYRIPASLPFLGLGRNVFDPGFPVRRMPRINAAIGTRTFRTLDQMNALRRRNAEHLRSLIGQSGSWRVPTSPKEHDSVDLRFPLIFNVPENRGRFLHVFQSKGLGASIGYPSPLDAIPGFGPVPSANGGYPGAAYVSQRLLTLPTHPFVHSENIRSMHEALMQGSPAA